MKILIAEHDLYLAEVGRPAALRVALGPRVAPDYDRSYWEKGGSGGWDASIIIVAIVSPTVSTLRMPSGEFGSSLVLLIRFPSLFLLVKVCGLTSLPAPVFR